MNEILIWMFSLLAVMAALLLVITRSVLYGACALVVTLLSLAAIYVLMHAEFVGVTQLMIYVGGVIILLLFAIMLTRKRKGESLVTAHYNRLPALLLFAVSLGVLGTMAMQWSSAIPGNNATTDLMHQTGVYLMTTYLLPMELVAVLLLLVLIGALTIAGENFRKGAGNE